MTHIDKVSTDIFNGSYILCQIVDLFQIWGDIPKMTATACLLFTNLAHFIKIVNVIAKRSVIQTIINDAHLYLISETGDAAKEIVNSCNFETKRQQLLYFFITLITIIGWAVGPEDGQLPIPSWYPFDASKWPAYEIAYSHQVVAVLICGCLNIAKDTLAVTLIAQCCCRLKLLGLSLRTICSDNNIPADRLLTLEEEKIVKSRLRICVTRHQAALDAAEQLQQAFSEPTFVQFLVSLIIICVTAFQMVSQTSNLVRLGGMALYLSNMMYQVLIYCYQGDKLAQETLRIRGWACIELPKSTAVADAVYAVPWYACRTNVRRSLVVMTTRSRRVASLVAGGFTPLSLDSFMAIIKASYSLFTLLRRVEERE